LAPLIHRFNSSSKLKSIVCATGQHSELAEQMLGFFNLRVDYNFSLMKPNQRLSILTADLLTALQPVLEREKPDRIIVQGDTSSAMAGALAGFYNKIPVAHVEAALRTDNILAPFPAEAKRRIISVFAGLH